MKAAVAAPVSFFRLFCSASVVLSLTACGETSFQDKTDNRDGGEELAGETGDCFHLGNPGPGQHPGQQPVPVVVVPPGKGTEPVPPGKPLPPPPPSTKPCGNPGQHPGQTPCVKDCVQPPMPCAKDCSPPNPGPCPDKCDNGYVPVKPFPMPMPIEPGKCGKDGFICDNGGPVQNWPGQTVGGKPYDRHEVESCLGAFHRQGMNAPGQWGIDVREVRSVSVLSDSVVSDNGVGPMIVIIKSVGVLGRTHFQLMNPRALYCIKNVSVLEETFVTSCHTGNVVWGKDVNVLSRANTQVVGCP